MQPAGLGTFSLPGDLVLLAQVRPHVTLIFVPIPYYIMQESTQPQERKFIYLPAQPFSLKAEPNSQGLRVWKSQCPSQRPKSSECKTRARRYQSEVEVHV